MPLEAWFPLAIYYADLPDSSAHHPPLLQAIVGLRDTSPGKRTGDHAAWTGDVHAVEKLHLDQQFAWITDQVQAHVLIYLEALGLDLTILDVYIQRCWPVISSNGQMVGRHAHHGSHVSAVYYVSVPGGDKAGRLRFFNDAKFNELAGGLSTPMSGAVIAHHAFNYQIAAYQPLEGRLLIFPARQPHDVERNESDQDRISLSFDIVLTSRPERGPGLHEFLMPPPTQWLKCKRAKEP